MATVAQSQVNATSPDPYHQILVVSQATMNHSLKNMWSLAPKDSPLKKYSIAFRDGQSITSELNAGSVSLQVTQDNPQLYYFLKFRSGTLTLYVSDDPKVTTTKDYDLTGWSIAFAVKISSRILKEDDTDYGKYASAVGFDNGVFSLAQLYLDATTTTVFSESKSDFQGVDWSKEEGALYKNFKFFMTNWLNTASSDKTNIVGISVVAKSASGVNTVAPTFVPTSIDYYNYPWLDPASQNPKMQDDLDKNALCYLTMSGFTDPPRPMGIKYSGAFVETGATFCMHRDIFWNSWLLPLLQELNHSLEFVALTPYLEDATASGWTAATAPEYSFGSNPKHPNKTDAYFAFKVDGHSSWKWDSDSITTKKTITVQGCDIRSSELASSSTSVSCQAGGQVIAIKGQSKFNFNHKYLGTTSEGTFDFDISWHLNFAMQSVDDGSLQIVRVNDENGIKACKASSSHSTSGLTWSIDFDDYCDGLETYITSYFNNSLGWLTNDLIQALQTQHRLYLPASGVFLMKDPKFNHRGDLLATLTYNGAPAPNADSGSGSGPAAAVTPQQAAALGLHYVPQHIDVPDAFRALPAEWKHFPSRQKLVPAHKLRPPVPKLKIPKFMVKQQA